MSKSIVWIICPVFAVNLFSISYPALAASEFRLDRSSLTSLVGQFAATPVTEPEDTVFEDVVSGGVDKLKQFLDRGGSPNRYFDAAINAGSIDCVKLMLDRGANVNLPGDEGVTPLMTSVRVTYRNGLKITQLLIKRGANINAKAIRGSTPLMYAAWGVADHYQDEYVAVVRLLVKHGAKVNVRNKMGDSPLNIAKGGKWQKIVKILKNSGARF
jgi:uncharacterized protein